MQHQYGEEATIIGTAAALLPDDEYVVLSNMVSPIANRLAQSTWYVIINSPRSFTNITLQTSLSCQQVSIAS